MSSIKEWLHYSDIESEIIEDAFIAKEAQIILDDCCIDFETMIRIPNNESQLKSPIKRLTGQEKDRTSRGERFNWDPMAPEPSLGKSYGWVSPFILEARKYLNLEKQQLPSKDPSIVPVIVEKAAFGITEAGVKLGKQKEAERISKQLMDKKDQGIEEVWRCCIRLYTLDSFLYKTLNKTMRYIGGADHENDWRSMVPKLGPFALLLWDDPLNQKPNREKKLLYRGVDLSDAQIATYLGLSQESSHYRSFQAFTSCSRNIYAAEMFSNNALFIMEINYAFTADVQAFSQMPDEEEELIMPGVCFTVQSVEFDECRKKFLIYLNLKQRQSGE
jgi:hypothetical protein